MEEFFPRNLYESPVTGLEYGSGPGLVQCYVPIVPPSGSIVTVTERLLLAESYCPALPALPAVEGEKARRREASTGCGKKKWQWHPRTCSNENGLISVSISNAMPMLPCCHAAMESRYDVHSLSANPHWIFT